MVFSILFLIIMCDRFLRDLTEQKGPCRGRRKPAEAADDASADSSDNSSVEEDTDDEVLCDEDMHTLAEVESNSSSSSESDKETECTVPEPHYDAFDRHKKCVRRWKFEANGITETNYSRANTSSRWRNVPLNEWGKLSACDMYKMQRPAGEMECWKQFSDQNLKRKGYKESTLNEWEHFQGVLLAAAQGGFKGGFKRLFEAETRKGLFPPLNIGRHGMTRDRFWELAVCWQCEPTPTVAVPTKDWETSGLVRRFNEHYRDNFEVGRDVTIDESMFWNYIRGSPNKSIVGRKPRDTGTELKDLAAADCNIVVALEVVKSKKDMENLPHTREHGAAAAVTLRLCEEAGICGSNRIVAFDSFFANMRTMELLRANGLHGLGNMKTGHSGIPKKEFSSLMDRELIERGSHMVFSHITDRGDKIFACAWKGKSNRIKGKKRKNNFITIILATDCSTTLPGAPAEKKRHHSDGRRAPSKFVPRPKVVADFYRLMPIIDVGNHVRQKGLDIENAVQTSQHQLKFLASMIGLWEMNALLTAKKWHPHYIQRATKNRFHEDFTEDIIMEGLFKTNFSSEVSSTPGSRHIPATITVPTAFIDPFCHVQLRFKDVSAQICAQQRCIMCNSNGKRTMATTFCGTCTVLSPQVSSRVPSRNAYCIANQCFAKHAAECNTNSLEKNSASHCRVCTIDDVLRLPCVLNLPVETRSMAIASRRRRNAENERLNALPHGNREAHGTQRPTGFGPGRGNGSGRGNGRGLQRGHVRGGMHGRGCYSASQDRGDRVEENGSGEGKEEDFDDSSTIQTSQSLRRGRPHGGTGHRRSSNLSRTSTVSISMIQKHPV